MKERKNALYKLGEKEMVEEFMEVKEKHTFSDSYEDKKQKLLKEMEVKDHTRRFQRRKLIAAAAAAVIIMVPASTFAARQIISSMSAEKEQTAAYEYQIKFDETTGEKAEAGDTVVNGPLFHTPVQMNVNYMLDGFVHKGDNKYSYEGKWESKKNVTVALGYVDADQIISVKNAVSSKDVTVGDKKGMLFYMNALDDEAYDKNLFILFPEYGYVVQIFAQVNITEEDVMKIAENVTLESCDASVATKYAIYKDARDTEPVQASNSVTPSATTFDENQSVELNTPIVMSDDKYMYNASVEYTIEGYELRDTIAGLPQAGFGYTWDSIQNIVNSDGTFAGYTHREIKRGDGANSVNEVVGENHVDVKMVYVTMKVKNTSDKEVSEIKIAPQMCCLNEDGSIPNQYTVEKVGYEGRDVYCDALTMYQEDPEAYAGQQQHYAQRYRLAPGEEKEVHVGYLVDASRTNRMVLFFNGYGRIYKSGANEAANQKIVKLY